MLCSECAMWRPGVPGVTVGDRWFCSDECVTHAKVRPPKRVRGGKMSEEAKAALRKVIAQRKMLVLKNIDPIDLLVGMDHFDEHDDPSFNPGVADFTVPSTLRKGRWVPRRYIECWYIGGDRRVRSTEAYPYMNSNYPWCWLRHSTSDQETTLMSRLTHHVIYHPPKLARTRWASTNDHRSRRRVVFPLRPILWILTRFYPTPVDVTKYVAACTEEFVARFITIKENVC